LPVSHPSLAFLFHCSPPDILFSSDSISVTLLSAACSVWSGSHGATPGMPPTSPGVPLCLAWGCLANQLGILYEWQPRLGTSVLGNPFK
jgi:hypothetical protein